MSLIQVSNLSFTYDGSFQPVFENVNMQLDTAWRLGFIGRNGRGKTTFLKLLLGELHYQGSIHASVGFSYFPYPVKDSSQLALYVLESICPDFLYWQLLREMNLLGVPEEILYQPYNTLSNGEQTKLQLAVLLPFILVLILVLQKEVIFYLFVMDILALLVLKVLVDILL